MGSIYDLGMTADDFYRGLYDALSVVFEKSGSVFNDEASAALMRYDALLKLALGMPNDVRH
jgi:hypothetical protein